MSHHLCVPLTTYSIQCCSCSNWWSTTAVWKEGTVHHCPWCGEKATVQAASLEEAANLIDALQSISLNG